MTESIVLAVRSFLDFLDNRAVFRRTAFVTSVWMVYDGTRWAQRYAEAHADKPSIDVAAVITAVTAMVTLLMGYMAKIYTEDRAGKDE